MSKKELLPCPFCGSKARLVRIAAGCAAECTGCGVRMMLGGVGVGWYATDGEAAADWNRRQPSALAAPLAHAGQRERVLVEREQLERAASVVAWMSCRSDIKAADMKRLEQCASELSCALTVPAAQAEPVAVAITEKQVMTAYFSASRLHISGTSNWVAAFAQSLNKQIAAPPAQPDASVLSILRDALESVHYHRGMQNLGHEAGKQRAAELDALIVRIGAALAGKGGE